MLKLGTVLILALGLVATPIAARAQGGRLTLGDAMTLARKNAGEVTAAKARREASASRLREARGSRLPLVRLEESWIRTDSPAEAFALELNQERFSLSEFAAGNPNRPDPIGSVTTRLEVALPLYSGGELGGRILQAELAVESATESLQWVADQASLAAAEAYVALSRARERVALVERSLETVRRHADLARRYVEQGMLVRSELLSAEVEAARIEDLLSESRGHVRVAEASLSFRLGASLTSHWELDPLPAPPTPEGSLDEWLATAHDRSDLRSARALLAVGELAPRIRRSALRPKVNLFARHDIVDESFLDADGDSTAIIAVASLDLFAGGRHRAAISAAEADARAAREEVKRFDEAVQLEVREAWESWAIALERHATARQSIVAATEAERIVDERFRRGLVKTLDLIDAATSRREAETRELVARYDAHLAALRLAINAGRRQTTVLPVSRGDSRRATGWDPS